jgi:hypothetical protein
MTFELYVSHEEASSTSSCESTTSFVYKQGVTSSCESPPRRPKEHL